MYSYKFIVDCVEQNCLLDIASYRLVCIGSILHPSYAGVMVVQRHLFHKTQIDIISESCCLQYRGNFDSEFTVLF